MWLFLPGLIVEFIGVIILMVGIFIDSIPEMIAGICVIGSAIVIHLVQITQRSRSHREAIETGKPNSSIQPEFSNTSKIVYSDALVTITENAITFQNYSLFLKPRRVHFTDIDHIDVLEPALFTGKYRMWGSGDFSTWFPLDSGRSSRDKIFHACMKTRGMNIGFTVEKSGEVIPILRSKGLIGSEETPKVRYGQ